MRNRLSTRQAEFSRAIAAITGCLASYHPDDQSMSFSWPDVDLALGAPTGDVVFDDGTVSRSFEFGEARIDFGDATGPFPFDFEIRQAGEVAQSFDYPRHYP